MRVHCVCSFAQHAGDLSMPRFLAARCNWDILCCIVQGAELGRTRGRHRQSSDRSSSGAVGLVTFRARVTIIISSSPRSRACPNAVNRGAFLHASPLGADLLRGAVCFLHYFLVGGCDVVIRADVAIRMRRAGDGVESPAQITLRRA